MCNRMRMRLRLNNDVHVEAKEVATVSLGRSIVLGEAKSLHQANDEARREALEDPTAIGVVFSPSRPLGVPENPPESNYLMALGEEVSNNRHKAHAVKGRSSQWTPPYHRASGRGNGYEEQNRGFIWDSIWRQE